VLLAIVALAGSALEAACGPSREGHAPPTSGHLPGLDDTAAAAGQRPDSLRVHAGPGLEGVARRLARDSAVLAPMPGIGPPLAGLPEPPTLWVVRDLGAVPGAPTAEPDWVAGIALAPRELLAVRVDPESVGRLDLLRRTTRHELAHLALDRATGGRAPRWLQEGYAQLVAGDWDWSQSWRLRLALLRSGTDALAELDPRLRGRDGEDQARLAYMLSYTAVHRLAAMGADPGLRALFDRLARGDSMDVALRAVYGVTEEQFVRAWERVVRDRYGWLFLLSRVSLFWIGIALLMLLVGWRRRRYDRARMEALRREEATSEAAVPDGREGQVTGGDP
jgi:hypothetical protein